MDRSITYCTNAVCSNCLPVPEQCMCGNIPICHCADSYATPYGVTPYYNNQVMCSYISCIGGLTNSGDGICFNSVCVNTNFACSYVLAQILGCWPSGTPLSTTNNPTTLASCAGLNGLHCLVGSCDGCARYTGDVYRAFYCVSDTYPAVKVELTWTFVSNDYSTINGSGSTSCSCYGYKRQMVSTWRSADGVNGWEVMAQPWKTVCYLVYPGQCSFNCALFSFDDSSMYFKPFNPRHSYGVASCNNYGFGSGGLGVIRFAVYRHKDGRNVSSAASRNFLACYTCPVLKFYPYTQAGCSTINGLSLDCATCCCGYYYYGGCCGKLLGGSICMICQTVPTIDQSLAGTYYAPVGGWAIPMATWRYVCGSGTCQCHRNFATGSAACVKSTLRNVGVTNFESPDCKGAAICQLWRTYTGDTYWQTTYNMGNTLKLGSCSQLLMPIIMCNDTWTIDPSICGCISTIRARSGCHYILKGLSCRLGPYNCNVTKSVCLYKNGSCCGAITSCCQYELAMGQCKQRAVAMCGSSTLPVTDQNGCYILGVDNTIKAITYTGSATCCKPLFWKRSLQFCAGNTAFWWPSNYNA